MYSRVASEIYNGPRRALLPGKHGSKLWKSESLTQPAKWEYKQPTKWEYKQPNADETPAQPAKERRFPQGLNNPGWPSPECQKATLGPLIRIPTILYLILFQAALDMEHMIGRRLLNSGIHSLIWNSPLMKIEAWKTNNSMLKYLRYT